MLQPPAPLAFSLIFGCVGQKYHTPRDPVSECSWGTLAVWGPNTQARGTDNNWMLPATHHRITICPGNLWTYPRHGGCVNRPQCSAKVCTCGRPYMNFMKGFPSQCALLANAHLIFTSRGQKSSILSTEATLTLRCLNSEALSWLPLLCFTSRPHQKEQERG